MTMTPAGPTAHLAPLSFRSLWALICALLALIPFIPVGSFVLGPAAIVLGVMGRHDAERGMRGRGMATAAIVIGLISFAAIGAMWIVYWTRM